MIIIIKETLALHGVNNGLFIFIIIILFITDDDNNVAEAGAWSRVVPGMYGLG
jgi:hypothetical protein